MPRAQYYALRRFCPYQGVIQVVDVGAARAYSTDGRHWQVRIHDAAVQPRMVRSRAGMRIEGEAATVTADDLMAALNHRPPLPFPQRDRVELWLLHKKTLLPLALLKTRCSLAEADEVTDPTWRPFLSGPSAFDGNVPRRRDALERQVNLAARPRPVVQWFERLDNGSGIGRGGMRVEGDLPGRHLPAEAFPELLVDGHWDDPDEARLVADYHRWNAAMLLAHQGLSRETRAWLEAAVGCDPLALLRNHPMYPEVLDQDAMRVAMVKAKLIASSE